MIEDDTIKLLRECDSGIKMGVSAIEDVIKYVKSEEFKYDLNKCKDDHDRLHTEIVTLLHKYQDKGKNPNPVVKGMSLMKTNMKLVMDKSDQTIADLMTDGCNMGVKSLNRYLNLYKKADDETRRIAKRLINLEHQLTLDIRKYL